MKVKIIFSGNSIYNKEGIKGETFTKTKKVYYNYNKSNKITIEEEKEAYMYNINDIQVFEITE